MANNKDNNNWLDELHKCSEKLNDLQSYLSEIADAFYTTGNISMYKRLNNISNEIYDIYTKINDVSGKIVTEMFKTSQENSRNMFNAILAGIKINKDNKQN